MEHGKFFCGAEAKKRFVIATIEFALSEKKYR